MAAAILVQCLEAFAIGAMISCVDLLFTKYPRTIGLVTKSPSLYLYAMVYGLAGAIVTFAYPYVFSPGAVAAAAPGATAAQAGGNAVAGFLLNDPWRRAAVIGIGIKAFLHVRLFDIPIPGGKPFPFGVETLTHFFEPWLLRSIELDYWLALTRFLAPARTKYTDLTTTPQIALGAVPGNFDPTTKAAMLSDINAATTAFDVLQVYLTNTGRAVFLVTFP